MRRLLVVIAGVLALCGVVPPVAHAAQTAGPVLPGPTVGIRLVDVPTSRADDPRARQYIIDHLVPGTTITRRVEVVDNNTATTQVVQLYAAAATVANGSFLFGAGRAANDLSGWTTVNPPAVSPVGGAKALATVTITVPANASSGERYGVVWAQVAPAVPRGGGVTAVNRVGVRIYLSVGPGGDPATDFAITALDARRAADGSPLLVATVRNTGGRAVDLSGELGLADGPGGLSAGPFPAKLGTTLGPGQVEPVLVILDKAIPAGPWNAHIVLRSGTTQRDATTRVTFPAGARTSAPSVRTTASSGGPGLLLLVLVGVALLLAVLLALALLRRRRRRPPTDQSGPAAHESEPDREPTHRR
ncbi:MAG: peptidase [Acidimicrobiales bacterium]